MWVAISIVVVLVGAFFVLQRFSKKSQAQTQAIIKELFEGKPEGEATTFEWAPSQDGDWERPEVRKLADPMRKLGFEPIGVYGNRWAPNVESYAMRHSVAPILALIQRLKKSGTVMYEYHAWDESGNWFIGSFTPLYMIKLPHPEWLVSKSFDVWDEPKISLKVFGTRIVAGRILKSLEDDPMEQLYEARCRLAEWRRDQKKVSDSSV